VVYPTSSASGSQQVRFNSKAKFFQIIRFNCNIGYQHFAIQWIGAVDLYQIDSKSRKLSIPAR